MKLCECGCGNPAPLARDTNVLLGYKQGQPIRFIQFHHDNYKRGADHPEWKGGRRKTNRGYILVYCPEHPRATALRCVFEHIIIAERALGHYLPSGVVVHHVNEDRGDNRNSNLVICENNAYHALLHQRMRAMKAGVPANWLKCQYCQRYDAPERLYTRPSGTSGYHSACVNIYHRNSRLKKQEQVCL